MLRNYGNKTIVKGVLSILFFSQVFYSHFFFDGFSSTKDFVFLSSILALIVLCIIAQIGYKSKKIEVKYITLFLIAFSVVSIFSVLIHDFSLINNHLFNVDLFLFIYLAMLIWMFIDKEYRFFLIKLSLLLTMVLSLIGVLQWVNVFPSYSPLFKLTGTFLNPGPYTCLLSMLMTILITILFYIDNGSVEELGFPFDSRRGLLLLRVVLFIGILVIAACNIRTGLIVLFIIPLAIFFYQRFQKTSSWGKTYLFAFLMLSVLIASLFAFLYKKDSSTGRLLIWKVALTEPAANVIFGGGYEYFERHYNEMQSHYFVRENINPNSKAAKLAGNVTYAYNEFIEVYFNYGLVGLISCFAFIFFILKAYSTNYNSSSILLHISFYVLLSVFIQSLISYPFSMLGCKMVFVSFLALFVSEVEKSNKIIMNLPKKLIITLQILLICVVLKFSWNLVKNVSAFRTWKIADFSLKRNNQVDDAVDLLKLCYPTISSNGSFLVYYGRCLFLSHKYNLAISVLNQSKRYSADPIIYYTLGQSYSILNDCKNSELNFNLAINMMPNRLYPRYLLMQHFIRNKDSIMVKYSANNILSIEDKVASEATMRIKSIAKQYATGDNLK